MGGGELRGSGVETVGGGRECSIGVLSEQVLGRRKRQGGNIGHGLHADSNSELYTDESPGLKVDPVVVMTLSVVFIFSVVALHGMSPPYLSRKTQPNSVPVIAKVMRKISA